MLKVHTAVVYTPVVLHVGPILSEALNIVRNVGFATVQHYVNRSNLRICSNFIWASRDNGEVC